MTPSDVDHLSASGRHATTTSRNFLGAPPMENRQLYFDASPISYATFANNKIGVLLVTGTAGRPGRSEAAHTDAVPACAQAGRLLRAPVHRARRAALLDERSDRGADQLFGLSGAAADALSGGEAVTGEAVARMERTGPARSGRPDDRRREIGTPSPGFAPLTRATSVSHNHFFSSISVPSCESAAGSRRRLSPAATAARTSARRDRPAHRWCRSPPARAL